MKRLVIATVVATLALPASALASTSHGVVLSVDASQHSIQVVDAAHAVHLYRYHGRLPKLHAGSRIDFSLHESVISHVRSRSGVAGTVSFYARVVHSSVQGLVLVTADGRELRLGAQQLAGHGVRSNRGHRRHAPLAHLATGVGAGVTAGSVTVNLLGLQPGVTVLITESTDASGNVTITITLPPTTAQGPQSEQASGVVSEVDQDAFVLEAADGSELRLHMTEDALSNLNLQTCNTVNVTYHQDAGLLIADNVQITGTSTTGDCTPTQDSTGTITTLTDQTLTIQTSSGPQTFQADPSLTDGFYDGDVVDVTYVQNPDGSLTAQDVEYVEMDASGTVTASTPTSVTITDANTGQPDVFIADPNDGVQISAQTFAGVLLGDSIDVTYHQSAQGLVADSVDDNGPAGSSGGSGNSGSGN